MSIDPMDPRPPYRQIADHLRQAIYKGELGPGGRLPSERQLVDRYGTAHQTARQAINLLKTEGLVIGRPGRGVFVRERPPLLLQLEATRRFITQAKSQGREAEARLLGVEFLAPPAAVADRLDLENSARAVCRRYLAVIDDEPTHVAETYFPEELVRGSAIAEPVDLTPAQVDSDLKERLGIEPDRFADELSARMPTTDETRTLRLHPGTPVIDLLRTYSDRVGKSYEVVRFVMAGDKQVLLYEGRTSDA